MKEGHIYLVKNSGNERYIQFIVQLVVEQHCQREN